MSAIDRKKIEALLARVQKATRYAGCEMNSIIKHVFDIHAVLSYPDLYEVGMSNSGIRILYDVLNAIDGVFCERVFAVARDFEEMLRDYNVPLYSLESYTPLKEFDFIGFNVAHELLSTNILQILDLGMIPLKREDRGDAHPLIIAGGESVSNPFPLFDFIDIFFIGDGEEGIVDVAEALKVSKERSLGRKETVDMLADIEGVLIPERYSFSYEGWRTASVNGPEVKKRVYRGTVPAEPVRPVVSNMRIVQERVTVEAARGCPNFCSFCHAGFYDLPYRCYGHDDIVQRVLETIENTGYNEVTLSALSVSDYPYLAEMINALLPVLTEEGVSISLPSLKVDRETIPVIEQISGLRKSSLTFAVESASPHIRNLANKRVSVEELMEIMEHVYKLGWRVIKLYFMIGLPGSEDIDEVPDMVDLLMRILNIGKNWKDINVTLSPFVPKPHTPFQRERQMSMDYFDETVRRIKSALPRKIKIKNHDVRASVLEGIFSRGDQRLGQVIYLSYREGCRLDSWQEHLRFDLWKRNLDDLLPWWEGSLGERGDKDTLLWDVVSTGFEDIINQGRHLGERLAAKKRRDAPGRTEPAVEETARARIRFEERYAVAARIRIILTKRGMMRFVPHTDFVEIVKRGLRMAKAPVAMTQGFNKRERISAGFPVPVGVESDAEIFDVELYGPVSEILADDLSGRLPCGVEAVSIRYLDEKVSVMAVTDAVVYRVTLPPLYRETVSVNLAAGIPFTRVTKKGRRDVAFNEVVMDYSIKDDHVVVTLFAGTENAMRIDAVIAALASLEIAETAPFTVVKTDQLSIVDGELVPIR